MLFPRLCVEGRGRQKDLKAGERAKLIEKDKVDRQRAKWMEKEQGRSDEAVSPPILPLFFGDHLPSMFQDSPSARILFFVTWNNLLLHWFPLVFFRIVDTSLVSFAFPLWVPTRLEPLPPLPGQIRAESKMGSLTLRPLVSKTQRPFPRTLEKGSWREVCHPETTSLGQASVFTLISEKVLKLRPGASLY